MIQKSLEKLIHTYLMTLISLAHRLSTLKNMDRIIVLDKSCVVEEGTHESLMEKAGTYASLHDLQTK